jgi:hypothetical protein
MSHVSTKQAVFHSDGIVGSLVKKLVLRCYLFYMQLISPYVKGILKLNETKFSLSVLN